MKILIIEDDAIVAVMQKMWITKVCQCEAEVFSNGQEALEFLDIDCDENPEEDYFIFLDINMPVMNGWNFLQVCEKRSYVSRISVVVVTSSRFVEDYRRAKQSPLVVDFQNKPMDASSILRYFGKRKKGEPQGRMFPEVNLN
ncbi:response regulator [Salinimicrobium catena]|uniref:response regulator n=1 Tax=Salinimicrobium catena TaxID=390640 RepID=UPI002FE46C99